MRRLLLPPLLLLAACAAPPPRNVVVVVIDTLRQDHVSAYGYARATTPYIDGLAAEGAVFDAVAPTSWTKSSVASLLTGLHPLRHQAFGYADALTDEADTLAELLGKAGWSTAAVSANAWVAERFGLAQGFGTFAHASENRLRDADATEVNELVAGILPRLKEPFFLYVHYVDPHAPYEPRFAWDGGPLPSNRRQRVTIEDLQMATSFARPADLIRESIDLYDGEIRQVDDAVRELRGMLEGKGLHEHTLWVITSDHGEEFEEHGRMGHGQAVYDESVRVPLIFSGPGAREVRPKETVSLLDVVPTLLDLFRVVPPASLDGVSLVPLLHGEPAAANRDFLLHLDLSMGHQLGLLAGCNALTLGGQPAKKELFDVCTDRRTNIWHAAPEEQRLELANRLAATYNRLQSAALERRTAGLDDRLASELSALGYVGASKSIDKQTFFPRRLRAADDDQAGLLGWEDVSQFGQCVDFAAPVNAQLVSGWYPPELNGRWADERGIVALPRSAGRPARLVVRGTSHRPDEFELSVMLEGKALASQVIRQGPYALQTTIGPSAADYVVVDLRSSKVFKPAEHGSPDQRALGVFVESLCLEPIGDVSAAAAAN